MKLLRSPEFNMAAFAIIVAAVTGLAYAHLGFFGVVIVGVAILFASAQSDIQKETFRGLLAMENMTPAERRVRRSENDGMSKAWRFARRVGLALTAIGGLGFLLLQLPH